MPRSMGHVVVGFGLVNVPMKLYSTVSGASKVSFNLLSPTGNRVKQQYVDSISGEVVSNDQMQKGYEFAKGQFVVFTKEEVKALAEASSANLAISEFVPIDQVKDWAVEKSYYLTPDKGGEKGYELLRSAMMHASKVGIMRHCSHGKQHLACLRATDQGMILQHLHYHDEIVAFSDVHAQPVVKPSAMELAMANQLVEMVSSPMFDPTKYHDEVKQRLEAAIQTKISGHAVEIPDADEDRAATLDLLEQLKKSLGQAA